MAGAAANIAMKEIAHVVAIFARTSFANIDKLPETRVGVFMTGAVIFPEGSFGVGHPYSPNTIIFCSDFRKEQLAEACVSLLHTLVIKPLTVD
jgi:hypothetical protein